MKFSELVSKYENRPWPKLRPEDKEVLRINWSSDAQSEIDGVVDYIYSIDYGELKACVKGAAYGADISETLSGIFYAATTREVHRAYERERKMQADWLAEGVNAL